MDITLAQLCRNAEKNYNMKLIAGRGGMDNTVRWVHMVEDSEVPDFLHGNELVFTTGIGHLGNEWLEQFVKSLKEHKAVGLVVNLGPHISAIPPRVISYCEENDFPLFTLPWQVRIIDITYSFCRKIIDDKEAETTLAGAFRNLIFSPDKRENYAAALERMGFPENSSFTLLAMSVGEDKAAAVALVDQANGALMEVNAALAEIYLVSPATGVISATFPKVGELVGQGSPIMTVTDLDDMWFTFNVREDYLHGLQQGDKVTVSIPALDGKECTATVNYIAVRESYATWKATKETGMYDAKTFEVRAIPDTKVDGLRPGMSAIIKDAKLLKK